MNAWSQVPNATPPLKMVMIPHTTTTGIKICQKVFFVDSFIFITGSPFENVMVDVIDGCNR
jgi:hypothetical protein